MKQQVVRVYEYERLREGALRNGYRITSELLEGLRRTETLGPYWRVRGQEVQFQQYVGVVRIGHIDLEILPKLDQTSEGVPGTNAILVDLLRATGILPKRLPLPAGRNVRVEGLMEQLMELYVNELAQLQQRRKKQYRVFSKQESTTLRGAIEWPRHVRRPPGSPLGWSQRLQRFSDLHPIHAYLGWALQLASRAVYQTELRRQIRMEQRFWGVPNQAPARPILPARWTRVYATALQLADLIVHALGLGLRAGPLLGGALLFDMHHLFERFITRQLAEHRPDPVQLRVQQRHPFWRKQWLQPDIYLQWGTDRVIADAKWKQLINHRPGPDDLRQLYVYQRFFEAGRGFLIFPTAAQPHQHGPKAYAPTVVGEPHPYDCSLLFVPLLLNGALNRSLGQHLYQQFFPNRVI